jgi:hypothetical protein
MSITACLTIWGVFPSITTSARRSGRQRKHARNPAASAAIAEGYDEQFDGGGWAAQLDRQ